MGGFFGVASKNDCLFDLFFGTDYHSHLGTRRGGMAVYGENGFDSGAAEWRCMGREDFRERSIISKILRFGQSLKRT